MKQDAITLILSDARGVYIPQNFAEDYLSDLRQWSGISVEDRNTLLKGPDHDHRDLNACASGHSEWYWDAWCNVLDNGKHRKTGYEIYQDGDCWLVDYDQIGNDETISEAVDLACEKFDENGVGQIARTAAMASLYSGPGVGLMGFDDACNKVSETMSAICDDIEATMPEYIMGDMGGFEETTRDIWDAVIRQHFDKELAPYLSRA